MDQIFIQIASYRDVELPLTIRSALDAAKYPERLTFGICWQYDERTFLDLDEFVNNPRIKISQTYYENSRGCCWARNQTNLLYDGERYTLQIDAHTRFAQNWDERYIAMLNSIDSNKPIISTYPAPFEYIEGVEFKQKKHGMQRLILNRVLRNLTTVFKSEIVEDTSKPAPSKFIAAGQIFAHGNFCQEVEYDPEHYYSGEEIALSARAYTHGYDAYCPNEDLIWHLYKHSMPTHDADHHQNQHPQAIDRLHDLFIGDHTNLGKYGLGSIRTLADFEEYTEINFANALNRQPIPCHFKQTVQLDMSTIKSRKAYDYMIFSLKDINGKELYRVDLYGDDIPTVEAPYIDIHEELEDQPVTYMLWPHTQNEGYLKQFHEDL
jgi:hypothetical protein